MKIGIVAGEKSGDLLGAELVKEIKRRYPEAQFQGLAGSEMQAQGVSSLAEMEKISIMGIVGVLKSLFEILSIRRKIRNTMLQWQPDVFIGIDVPDFNLDLELKLKEAGIPTVHYVSPTVWAWRGHRIHKIRHAVNLMLTLFPFEKDYYQQQAIPVEFVGHPLAKQVADWSAKPELITKISQQGKKRLIALLPGSRMSEVSRLAPIMFKMIARLQQERSDLSFVLPAANQKLYDFLRELKTQFKVDIAILDGYSQDVLALCNCAVLASGTAALEAALFAKPMIVMYKVPKFEEWYAARTMQVEHFSMPNHLVSPPPVPELIQQNANEDELYKELNRLLDDEDYFQTMKSQLASIAPQLNVDSAKLASDAILKMLSKLV